MREAAAANLLDFPIPEVPYFLGIQDFLFQTINMVCSQMLILPKTLSLMLDWPKVRIVTDFCLF